MAYNPFNPWGYNPMQTYMPQNTQQMPMQAPQTASYPQAANNQQAIFPCRPVTSRAEAEVFQIPFDGSTTYFVDTANGKIYSKTFNFNDGTAPLVTYIKESDVPVPKYATMEDLEALRAELTKPRKAVKKNAEPDSE